MLNAPTTKVLVGNLKRATLRAKYARPWLRNCSPKLKLVETGPVRSALQRSLSASPPTCAQAAGLVTATTAAPGKRSQGPRPYRACSGSALGQRNNRSQAWSSQPKHKIRCTRWKYDYDSVLCLSSLGDDLSGEKYSLYFRGAEMSLLGLILPIPLLFPWSTRRTPSRYGQSSQNIIPRQWSNRIYWQSKFCQHVMNVAEQDCVKGREKDAAVIQMQKNKGQKVNFSWVNG